MAGYGAVCLPCIREPRLLLSRMTSFQTLIVSISFNLGLITEWCWNLPEHRTSQLQEMGGLPVQNNKGLECLLPACRHRECWRRECWRGKGQCHIPFIKLQSQDCWSLATLVRLKNEQTMGCFWLLGNTVPVVISSRAQSTKKQTVASLSLTFLSLSLISS